MSAVFRLLMPLIIFSWYLAFADATTLSDTINLGKIATRNANIIYASLNGTVLLVSATISLGAGVERFEKLIGAAQDTSSLITQMTTTIQGANTNLTTFNVWAST